MDSESKKSLDITFLAQLVTRGGRSSSANFRATYFRQSWFRAAHFRASWFRAVCSRPSR